MLALRFDVDTRAGLVDRVPPLLDLLDRHGLPATFFVVMGREANLVEIVRLRLLAPRSAKSPLNVAAKGGPLRILRAAVLPRAVGSGNPALLRQVAARRHELQPHGWSHIRWQRSLPALDVLEHLDRARGALHAITGVAPDGWASPGRSCDERVLSALDERGLLYGGDLDGRLPFVPPSHRHLQLPVSLFETIAQMRSRGLGDDEIVRTYLRVVEDNPDYCCLYEHPDDLGPAELRLFDRVFSEVVRGARGGDAGRGGPARHGRRHPRLRTRCRGGTWTRDGPALPAQDGAAASVSSATGREASPSRPRPAGPADGRGRSPSARGPS